jgi:UDP-3-O-[3-hydroxymyristoyl] glucosamine N-acyltransferase
MIGGQVGISGHLVIGNNVRVQAQSGVGRSIKDDEVVQGSPAFNYSDFSKSYVHFKNLPKIISEIDELKKKTEKEQ